MRNWENVEPAIDRPGLCAARASLVKGLRRLPPAARWIPRFAQARAPRRRPLGVAGGRQRWLGSDVKEVRIQDLTPSVEREPAGEIGEVIAQNQPTAVQTRLERLVLHPEQGARFFGRQAMNVPEQDRDTVD